MPVNHIDELLRQQAEGRTHEYLYFWGNRPAMDGTVTKSCLSQWFTSPFSDNGLHFATAEHFMMWSKAQLFGDDVAAQEVLAHDDPSRVKAIGRTIKNFDDELWKAHRFDIVVQGNRLKFTQNAAFRKFLLATGERVLVEASPVDAIWGVGLAADDERIVHPSKWEGLNLLGFALMVVRDELRG